MAVINGFNENPQFLTPLFKTLHVYSYMRVLKPYIVYKCIKHVLFTHLVTSVMILLTCHSRTITYAGRNIHTKFQVKKCKKLDFC